MLSMHKICEKAQYVLINIMNKLEFAEFEFIDNFQTLNFKWLSNTEDLIDEKMRGAFLEFLALVEKRCPQNIILDERELKFTYDPDFQEWLDSNILIPMLVVEVKRFAILKSKDFFINLATEQLYADKYLQKFEVAFFESLEDARHWLDIQDYI